MRRLPRILINAVTVMSLVLCAATAVLWVRSYWYWDKVAHTCPAPDDVVQTVWSQEGWLHLYWKSPSRPGTGFTYEYQPIETAPEFGRTPWRMTVGRERGYAAADFAHWHVILATAITPAIVAIRWRRRRARVANGSCPACGYDLRATPDRCPECGDVPPPRPSA